MRVGVGAGSLLAWTPGMPANPGGPDSPAAACRASALVAARRRHRSVTRLACRRGRDGPAALRIRAVLHIGNMEWGIKLENGYAC